MEADDNNKNDLSLSNANENSHESEDLFQEISNENNSDDKDTVTETIEQINQNSPSCLESGVMCKVNLNVANTKCCISSCSSNFGKINSRTTFVTFPKDPSRFAEWARAIKRPDLNLNASTKRANLLICSNHFPKSMWVNSNTRLKKLHKSAVPELLEENFNNSEDEDDVAVVEVMRPTYKPGPKSSKSGGLKVRKVSSLLTASALKESTAIDSTNPAPNIVSKLTNTSSPVSKLTTPRQRKHAIATTTEEKRLFGENEQLKSELDTNMDYILKQKSHYESVLEKEKEKSASLLDRVNQLESEHRKGTKNFDFQMSVQKLRTIKSEASSKDSSEKLKKALASAQDYEKKYIEVQTTITVLRQANDNLITRVNEMADNSPPPPAENILQGDNFKVFLNGYLKDHKLMKEKIDMLTQELEDKDTSDGQRSLLLSLASQHLTHGQFAWLQVQLSDMTDFNDCPDHFKEFCISLYQVSEIAYKVCLKAFGLAPIWCVKSWIKDPQVDCASVNSMINTLFEESKPLRKGLNIQVNVLSEKTVCDTNEDNGRHLIKIRPTRRGAKKRKIDSDSEDDEERDEGMLSDEDEELCYSSESDEEINDSEIHPQTSNGRPEKNYFKNEISAGPSQSSAQPDFDFMLDESSHHMGSSMPILGPSSPMAPLAGMSHNRKKMPDVSIPSTSGSKVIFRVVEP